MKDEAYLEPAGFGIGSQERRFIPASGTVSRVRASIMAGERGGPRQAAVNQSDGAERRFVSPDMRVKLLPKSLHTSLRPTAMSEPHQMSFSCHCARAATQALLRVHTLRGVPASGRHVAAETSAQLLLSRCVRVPDLSARALSSAVACGRHTSRG